MDVENAVNTKSVSCQTDRMECPEEQQEEPDVLFCWSGFNEASTQTQIFFKPQSQQQRLVARRIRTRDRMCGTNTVMYSGFTGFERILSDCSMQQLAGVSRQIFLVFLNLIETGENGQPSYCAKLTKESMLLLFLVKIKSGLTFAALGCIFGIHKSTASKSFFKILDTLAEKTKTWICWPPKTIVQVNQPFIKYRTFANCKCILDCMEVPTNAPLTAEQRELMYSKSKGRYTVKFLIAFTPDGYVCKVSKGYGGRFNDSFISDDCGFLDFIQNGDVVVANKGFSKIKPELSKREATLLIPKFECSSKLMTSDNSEVHEIPSVRSHVAKTVKRLKIFGILHHFDLKLLDYADAIMHTCCIIANTQPPLIRPNKTL